MSGHPSLTDRYQCTDGTVYLTGIQALARVPVDQRRADARAGRSNAAYISGYEGSPLAGYDLELGRNQPLLGEHDIVFSPAVNEELAATAVQGTQLAATLPDCRVDGVTGYWYGKSPGLDRASDALRHNNLAGTHPDGGAVAFVGDDPAAKSSTVPGSSEQLLADLGIPTLYPADPQEVLDLGLHAVAISRSSGLWTALKIATAVADGAGPVRVSPRRIVPVQPELDGRPYRHAVTGKLLQPTLTTLERSRNGARLELARRYANINGINRITHRGPHDRIGIVAAGKTYLDVRSALRTLRFDDDMLTRRGVRLLHLRMIYPIDPMIVKEFAEGLDEIIIVEEKRAFVELAIKDALYSLAESPVITGKRNIDGTSLFPDDGELDVDLVADGLTRRLGGPPRRRHGNPLALPIVSRTPYFCSGCPHNTSTKAPQGSLIGAGIGCHGLVVGMPSELVSEVTGLTQMGGEGAQWLGMQPFVDRRHLFQNLGDGTYHHSGSLAVRAAVAGRVNITYKLLYNSTVAMTGGQDAVGQMTIDDICRALLAEGVRKIIVTTETPKIYGRRLRGLAQVWPRERIIEAQEKLSCVDGVTVLIHDQKCATELRRDRKRGREPNPTIRIMINERVCEGCGDCGVKSNCLSVHPADTEFGRKTTIDQSSCNMDYSCLAGDCPSFVSVATKRSGTKDISAPEPLSDKAFPEPVSLVATQLHTTRILGIGGSGVVTLSQILGAAASSAGRYVVSLDQTGIAQKGGAVVSDVKMATHPVDLANRAADGEADLYLGADLLVAADPAHLRVADRERTVAVVSTSVVPTGGMVTDTAKSYPAVSTLTDRIGTATRPGSLVLLDARAISQRLFGSDQFANLVLLGAAYQSGTLALPAAAIEEAITLNGVQIDANIQAFRRGRQAVHEGQVPTADLGLNNQANSEPCSAAAELIAFVGAPQGSELDRLVRLRVPDLVAYQNVSYAKRYAHVVRRVAVAEARGTRGSSAVSEAVAFHLHKLMAYKDEYEVARLSLDSAFGAAVHATFGSQITVSYRLHPPLLRMLGLRHKVTLGPWFRVVYAALVRLRRLRGTPLDPFGWTRLRRLERCLIDEYIGVIDELTTDLSPDTSAAIASVATLPDLIRGYEKVKLDNVARYHEELGRQRRWIASGDAARIS